MEIITPASKTAIRLKIIYVNVQYRAWDMASFQKVILMIICRGSRVNRVSYGTTTKKR